jgi:hypothetical protein
MLICVIAIFSHLTVKAINGTALASVFVTLKLERRVPNAIFGEEHFFEMEQDRCTFIQ